MELKVWVDGVVRVVCGLALDTSCKAVVIALAQSLGQTGRYLLVMKLHETERQLEANDCPLQLLAQLGQLSAQVQFTLQRTGPSLEHGPNTRPRERHRPGSRPTEPQSLQQRVPGKASRSSAHPRKNHLNRSWSPSPHVSSELRASPLSFLDQTSSKEEVFRHILQQEQRLRDLQVLLQSLDRETALWELDSTSAPTPGPNPNLVERLEERLRQNEAELLLGEHWEGELEAETDRERELHRHLEQIHSSLDDHGSQLQLQHLQQLQQHAECLRQDLNLPAHPQTGPVQAVDEEEVLKPLQQELQHRLWQAQELDATLAQTQGALRTAEQMVQDRQRTVEELNKELRQCKLQQFIQKSGGLPPDQNISQQTTNIYLINAGIVEQEVPGL
ncbi:ras association domain-containing protein 7-like [Takifugu flavidus]|uniref:ras association domain-containing protein 7-like n=1 Tax=Takifugu flavidus TaxID=433684 RepID=UPI0025448FF7|nr:ras association domain-containing protein 7-like [Takifugu flavidus]XP_056879736.1 ras association domain-containing protein 7-like [Takifugu flavidus]XP_056879740.1 ras association domain-containing protein 7-like [Takifugu flavidus]